MILNSQVNKEDFSVEFKEQIDYLNSVGYGDLNNDALWKWSSILYSIKELGLEGGTCVDIGGGRSPLTKILSNKFKVINVDKFPGGNWFPLKENNEYIKSTGIQSKEDNISYIEADFFNWAKEQEDNSIDFMYDSCSVIHFDINSTISKNDGCYKVGIEVKRILKPDGYFIIASDLLHPLHKTNINIEENRGEFLYFENMLSLYFADVGLSIEGFTNIGLNKDFYKNILSINTSLANYNKQNNKYYGIDDWKTFCHYEGTCEKNLSIGRFVFRKELL